MKKAIVLLAAIAIAAPAVADFSHVDRSNFPIYTPNSAVKVGETVADREGPAIYDSLAPGTSGYLAPSPASGFMGSDDYTTNSGTYLTAFKFVGGLSGFDPNVASGIIWFTFWSPTTTGYTPVDGGGIALNTTGAYIWTITLGTPKTIPHNGLFTMFSATSATIPTGYAPSLGQWYVSSSDAVVVGSNSTTIGSLAPNVNLFSFHTPEPTTLVLLTLGGLVLARRR